MNFSILSLSVTFFSHFHFFRAAIFFQKPISDAFFLCGERINEFVDILKQIMAGSIAPGLVADYTIHPHKVFVYNCCSLQWYTFRCTVVESICQNFITTRDIYAAAFLDGKGEQKKWISSSAPLTPINITNFFSRSKYKYLEKNYWVHDLNLGRFIKPNRSQ